MCLENWRSRSCYLSFSRCIMKKITCTIYTLIHWNRTMKHFAPRRLHISLMLWINRDTAYPGGIFLSISITHGLADFRFLLSVNRHLQERNGNLNRKIKYEEKIQRYIVTGDSLHGLCLVLWCGNDIRFWIYICPESSNTVHT